LSSLKLIILSCSFLHIMLQNHWRKWLKFYTFKFYEFIKDYIYIRKVALLVILFHLMIL